eukprot:TRINITY_DN10145_c0_g1_i1.p1 TRINITY_DN10145_c0_g1~~TRINITY_DN10145_c0_g1_i1.p1  ORF type:complete len:218 (-),score=57.89 TRINITY_DN10145_c0_g1_i1:113-766(-)
MSSKFASCVVEGFDLLYQSKAAKTSVRDELYPKPQIGNTQVQNFASKVLMKHFDKHLKLESELNMEPTTETVVDNPIFLLRGSKEKVLNLKPVQAQPVKKKRKKKKKKKQNVDLGDIVSVATAFMDPYSNDLFKNNTQSSKTMDVSSENSSVDETPKKKRRSSSKKKEKRKSSKRKSDKHKHKKTDSKEKRKKDKRKSKKRKRSEIDEDNPTKKRKL